MSFQWINFRFIFPFFQVEKIIHDAEEQVRQEASRRHQDELDRKKVAMESPAKKSKPTVTTFDMFADGDELPPEVLQSATVITQDATNLSLKDNWDDAEGYYRKFYL